MNLSENNSFDMSALTSLLDDAQETLVTVNDWVRWTATQFSRANLYFGHGSDNAWDEALYAVLWAVGVPYEHHETVMNCRLTRVERKNLAGLIRERIQDRTPLPYLTGEAHFCDLSFHVSRDVLIPRSPIAELIQQAFSPWLTQEPEAILDLCAGSGCIGIACAYAFPEAYVDLSDISPAAVDVAHQNIVSHHLEERVTVYEGDLFAALDGRVYDLIVSNPPYVDAEDMASLPAEYLAEPRLALASGDDGLDFTRRLLAQASQHLSENGCLVVEVGNSWPALEAAFPNVAFTWLEFENGGHGVFMLAAAELACMQAPEG